MLRLTLLVINGGKDLFLSSSNERSNDSAS